MRRGACALCLLLAASLPPLHGQHSVYVDDTLRAFSGEGQLAAAMARARRNDELSSVVDGELDLGPHDELQDEIITNPSNLAFENPTEVIANNDAADQTLGITRDERGMPCTTPPYLMAPDGINWPSASTASTPDLTTEA